MITTITDIPDITRVRVLTGHTDAESAYVVDDHPASFRLRCKKRYWIESGITGRAAGLRRVVTQTTNPRVAGEVWHTPKPDSWHCVTVLYLQEQPDGKHSHVRCWHTDVSVTPIAHARARLMGIVDQLAGKDREMYDALLAMSREQAGQWAVWDTLVAALAAHIRSTGQPPALVNGMWRSSELVCHLAAEDYAVYVATARELA